MKTIDQAAQECESLQQSHAAIYLALGTNEADHTKWPEQVKKLRDLYSAYKDGKAPAVMVEMAHYCSLCMRKGG